MICLGALVPHPPIMVEGIGRGKDLEQVTASRAAMRELDQLLAAEEVETLVVFSPHGTVFSDAIAIYGDAKLRGSLRRFGLNQEWTWETDLELATTISHLGREAGLPVYLTQEGETAGEGRGERLDHGVLAPLSFFSAGWMDQVRLVVIPLSYLPLEELYRFGRTIHEAADMLKRRIAVIASGDLSHCLQPGAPSGYDPRGQEFDTQLVALIRQNEVEPFFQLDPVLVEKAAECGFRSLIMLLGALDGFSFSATVHSYEGPFGVGYAVASFRPGAECASLVDKLFEKRRRGGQKRRTEESPLVRYARSVVEAYVRGESLPTPEGLEPFLTEVAGAFVSIKKHGQLRGCIGTTEPTQANAVLEVRQNAVAAAVRDPRFTPIEPDELEDLVFSVDLLKPAEPIDDLSRLDPARYGVIVSNGRRRGLLLPDLEGIETAAEQVAIAKRKAGLNPDDECRMERFEVVRYH
jgi:AmmeMemoRadiSam system protein A